MRASVRVSRPKKSATTPALWVRDLTVKERLSGASWRGEACRFKDKETAGEACRVAQPRAERSEGRRLSAAKEHE